MMTLFVLSFKLVPGLSKGVPHLLKSRKPSFTNPSSLHSQIVNDINSFEIHGQTSLKVLIHGCVQTVISAPSVRPIFGGTV